MIFVFSKATRDSGTPCIRNPSYTTCTYSAVGYFFRIAPFQFVPGTVVHSADFADFLVGFVAFRCRCRAQDGRGDDVAENTG